LYHWDTYRIEIQKDTDMILKILLSRDTNYRFVSLSICFVSNRKICILNRKILTFMLICASFFGEKGAIYCLEIIQKSKLCCLMKSLLNGGWCTSVNWRFEEWNSTAVLTEELIIYQAEGDCTDSLAFHIDIMERDVFRNQSKPSAHPTYPKKSM
jgi:hypothetical protein